jgi:hypothetical protein
MTTKLQSQSSEPLRNTYESITLQNYDHQENIWLNDQNELLKLPNTFLITSRTKTFLMELNLTSKQHHRFQRTGSFIQSTVPADTPPAHAIADLACGRKVSSISPPQHLGSLAPSDPPWVDLSNMSGKSKSNEQTISVGDFTLLLSKHTVFLVR